MIAFFPTLYPDELVYSWFCRYYVHSGCFTHKDAMRELYCKRSDNPSKEFVGNLDPKVRKRLEMIHPMEELILDHTMYPQYARFIPLDQKLAALKRLKNENCDVHHLFPVLPKNEDELYLRYCSLCAAEDRSTYGEAYWHRKHQIRNMSICTKHSCKLISSSVPAKSEQSFTFCPAEEFIFQNTIVEETDPLVIRYARYLEAVFSAPLNLRNDVPTSAILHQGLIGSKYLKPSGRSRYTAKLVNDINKFYTDIGVCGIASMSQVQRALLGERYDFSVICQIAFFLGMDWRDLVCPSLTPVQIKQEQSTHYMKDATPVDWGQLDAETAPLMIKLVRSVYDGIASENGRPERVSERLVYRELGLRRHQLEKMPLCRDIFERYTESYPENWARKIIWAYRKLEERGEPFYWSDIRRISGVKKEKVRSAIAYLKKYADEDTVSNLLMLLRMEAGPYETP